MKALTSLCFLTAAVGLFALVSCKPAADNAESGTAAASDNYPLKTCVVSGEPLGGMGEPVVYQHEGTTVKFCCENCIDDFKKDPAPYLKKLADASGK